MSASIAARISAPTWRVSACGRAFRFVAAGVVAEPERGAELAQHRGARHHDARARGVADDAARALPSIRRIARSAARATPQRAARTRARRRAAPPRRLRRTARTPAPSSARTRRSAMTRAHLRVRAQRARASARLVVGLLARRPCLVEEHEHGLFHPRENGELGREVARVRGMLGRVDEVEHDVGVIAHVAHRALREEERAVAKAVPYLRSGTSRSDCLPARAAARGARCRRSPACPTARARRLPAFRSADTRSPRWSRAARRAPRRRRARAACARASVLPAFVCEISDSVTVVIPALVRTPLRRRRRPAARGRRTPLRDPRSAASSRHRCAPRLAPRRIAVAARVHARLRRPPRPAVRPVCARRDEEAAVRLALGCRGRVEERDHDRRRRT